MTSRSECQSAIEEGGVNPFLLGWERWIDWLSIPAVLWPRKLRDMQHGADADESVSAEARP